MVKIKKSEIMLRHKWSTGEHINKIKSVSSGVVARMPEEETAE